MQNTIWKLTTLAAVIGCCFLTVLVLKEQKNSLLPGSDENTEITSNDPIADFNMNEAIGEPSGEITLIGAEVPEGEVSPLQKHMLSDGDQKFATNIEPEWGSEANLNPIAANSFSGNSEPTTLASRNEFGTPPGRKAQPVAEPAAFPDFGSQAEPASADFGSELNTEPEEIAFDSSPEPDFNEAEFGSELNSGSPEFAPLEEAEVAGANNGPLMVASEEEAFGNLEEPAEVEEETPAELPAFNLEEEPAYQDEPTPAGPVLSAPGSTSFANETEDSDPFSNDLPREEETSDQPEEIATEENSSEPTPLPIFESQLGNQPEPANSTPGTFPLENQPTPLTTSIDDEFIGVGEVNDNVPQEEQKPEVTLNKIAPETVVLGEPMVYQIIVKNVGGSLARNVVVDDRIPRGTKLMGTKPQAQLDPETKKLVWELGDLPAGEEVKIAVRVEPTSEGEIGSVSTVNFVAEIGSKTKVTAPKVDFDFVGPESGTAEIGQSVLFKYMVKNTGSADAEQVIIRNLIPEALSHPAGNDLEYEIGTLKAGEEKEVKLMVMAVPVGRMGKSGHPDCYR
ncbi:MAG: hypothetical protein R3C11_07830 [Planctomycetaceae bacterium]